MEKMYMKVQDLATAIGIGKSAAYALAASEGFPSIRVGAQDRDPARSVRTQADPVRENPINHRYMQVYAR